MPKRDIWNVGVHADVYRKEVEDLEIFIFPESNQHAMESYGWDGPDKIMIIDGEIDEDEVSRTNTTLNILDGYYEMGLKLANALNEKPIAKVIKGMYHEQLDKDD